MPDNIQLRVPDLLIGTANYPRLSARGYIAAAEAQIAAAEETLLRAARDEQDIEGPRRELQEAHQRLRMMRRL